MGQWFEEFEEVLIDGFPGLFICRSIMIDLGQIESYADTTKMYKSPNDCSKSIIYLRSGRVIEVVESYDTITDAIERMNKANEEQRREVWLDELSKAWKLRSSNPFLGMEVKCGGDKNE